MGIEDQKQFATIYKVAEQTLSVWKDRTDFEPRVRALVKKWAFGKTPTVVQSIYRSAVRGNDKSQKLWMQVFEGFTEKTENTEVKKVEVGVNDIRFLIDALPEPLKSKHYANLRELLDDANSVRNARLVEDNYWNERPAESVHITPDNDAPDVPGNRTDAVALRHSECVCEDMEWQVSTYHHQSTAWRR